MNRSNSKAFGPRVLKSALMIAPLVGLTTTLVACGGGSSSSSTAKVEDFAIDYPKKSEFPVDKQGSTHEITYNHNGGNSLWLTGPEYDALVEVALDGSQTFYDMPAGSGPHGEEFDPEGKLFVSFEHTNQVGKFDPDTGTIVAVYDVGADPHGLAIGSDGKTVWFTGKTKNTVGKIAPDGTVTNYDLPTPSALPIYVRLGGDGNMWVTELTANIIGRVTPDGAITEFAIPTANSRPIALVKDPEERGLWFSEEAGNNVGFIDFNGAITEYPIPKSQENVILAGLSFDRAGNLWVQQYVDQKVPEPAGDDHVIKIERSALRKSPSELTSSDFTFYAVPTRASIAHRIVEGPDGNMWFTELKTDKVGRVLTKD